MKKIPIKTISRKMLSDIHTPVGIYLRLRDRFRDTILLESTDFHVAENSCSYIGINAVAGIEITNPKELEMKLPGQQPAKISIDDPKKVPDMIWNFMERFEVEPSPDKQVRAVQGLFGYCTYDAVQFFEAVPQNDNKIQPEIPLMRYRMYQYVIVINHFKDELFLCEQVIPGLDSEMDVLESLIRSRDIPSFPFSPEGDEGSNMSDQDYMDMVNSGISHCKRGDVFQVVLSRRFSQRFTGDEFNVYRALRNINPSPYLFFFDYGDYKLMGSSPESQLIISNGKAIVHPIAGTFKRTGDESFDKQKAEELLQNSKENAEHVMLVDLARNDLSRICTKVEVTRYRDIHYYSHVIHLVSEVTGEVPAGANPFHLLAATFPAGTLSGAPKIKAMELISKYEPGQRSFYGGCIGIIGFDGSCNQAITIRSFLCKDNTLTYQAGAGIVSASNPATELDEVNNKLNALKNAIQLASTI